ncbi:MAG: MarR family transcriptional regulator [Actinomycetota bacterium]|nr:MarR family transcriptional regulator [Actinomycetota bacterium]
MGGSAEAGGADDRGTEHRSAENDGAEHDGADDLGIQLGLAYAAFVETLRDALADAGFDDLGGSFGYVFRALAGGPATLSELAGRLSMTTQGAAKIVEEMEAGGYVARRPHPDDGRSKIIELDDRGRAALAGARAVHRRVEERLTEDLGAADVAALRRALAAVIGERAIDPADRLLRPM